MTLVVDASVVTKWLLSDPVREDDTERATHLMQWVLGGGETIVQPVHWLAEVGSVLARLSPKTAEDDVLMLYGLELPVDDGPGIWSRACRLAVETKRHLFDTLYHAVALETPNATLVTADDRYVRAGSRHGCIQRLSDWSPNEGMTRE